MACKLRRITVDLPPAADVALKMAMARLDATPQEAICLALSAFWNSLNVRQEPAPPANPPPVPAAVKKAPPVPEPKPDPPEESPSRFSLIEVEE